MIERLEGDYLHLIPASELSRHILDGGWCWCSPQVGIVPKSDQIRTGALRLVRHAAYQRRMLMAPETA